MNARGTNGSTGLLGEQVGVGTLIVGWGRVAAMTTCVRNGSRGAWVRTTVRDRKGRERLSDPVFLAYGRRVDGTRYRTDLPAGPVGRKPGARRNGSVGDGPAARHASMIDRLTYA